MLSTTSAPTKPKVIILHGTTAKPERSWFPWLTWQLVSRDWDVCVPRLPTPPHVDVKLQSLSSWKKALFEQLTFKIDSNTIIIGHSTGSTFALNLMSELQTPIKALFLTASFAEELNIPEAREVLSTFVNYPFNWTHIKKMGPQIFVYHGSDDETVPLIFGENVAAKLGQKVKVIPEGKHLSTKAKFFIFEELLKDLLAIE